MKRLTFFALGLVLLTGCTSSPSVLITYQHNGPDSSYTYYERNHYVVYHFHLGVLTRRELLD